MTTRSQTKLSEQTNFLKHNVCIIPRSDWVCGSATFSFKWLTTEWDVKLRRHFFRSRARIELLIRQRKQSAKSCTSERFEWRDDNASADKTLFGGPYWFPDRGRDQWKETDWDKEWHLRVEKADIFSITVTAAAINRRQILKHSSSAREYWQQKLFSLRCDTRAELPVESRGTADWCPWHICTSIYTHLPLTPKQPSSTAGEGR